MSRRKARRKILEQKALELYERYYALMLHTAIGLTGSYPEAEDVVSDAVVSLMNVLDKLDSLSEAARRGYIIVAVRHAASRCSQNRARQMGDSPQELCDDMPSNALSPLDRLLAKERYDDVISAVNRLSDRDRQFALMVFVDGVSVQEAARRLSVTESTIRSRIFRIRKRIKALIREEWIDD